MSVSSESLNPAGQTVLGTVSSLLVNGVLHPLSTVKNRLMADPKLTLAQAAQPRGIYKGFQEMFALDAVVFALAFFVNNALKGNISDLNASIATGAAAVPFITVGEGVIANRQVNDQAYAEIFRRALRPAGLIATAGREVPFFVGVLYFAPMLQEKVEQLLPEGLLAEGISGALTGAAVGYATAPIDLIKTRVQTHEQPLSIGTAVRSVLAKEGWSGMMRGGGARSLYIGLTGSGMHIVQQTLPAYLPKGMHKDE